MPTLHTPEGYRRDRPERLLTQADVADLLQVSRWTLARVIRRGDLVGVRVGDRLRFRRNDVDAYLERNAEGGAP